MMNPSVLHGCLLAALLLLSPAVSRGGDAPQRWDIPSPNGEWLMRTWETDDGLPENSATAMVQDDDHFLWFGTFNGLVRFDGVRFSVFDPANTPELPSPGIVNLHRDRRGRLWISTLKGLVWREGDRWGTVPSSSVADGEFIRTFSERANGDVLLTTFGGRVLEASADRVTPLPTPPGVPGQGYLGAHDESGHWWVVQVGFIGRWNGAAWERMVPESEIASITSDRVACTPARDSGVWILLDSELRRYSNGKERERRRLPESMRAVWSMSEDRRGNLWICSSEFGVRQVQPDGRLQAWTQGNGLPCHGARFAFEDVEGNVWLGTSGGGLSRLKRRRFQYVGPEHGLNQRVVKSVWPGRNGTQWIGTYGGGLFRWRDSGLDPVPLPIPFPLGRYVQSVLTDRQGRNWVGTFGHGLQVMDDQGSHSVPFEQSGGDNTIALFEDSRGRVWISGGQGVSAYESGTYRGYHREDGSSLKSVRCFGEDRNGSIWVSDHIGVFRLQGERFIPVHAPAGQSLTGVACFHAEPDGTLWMGTVYDGLIRWRNRQLARITHRHGLPVRGIFAILADEAGFYWMASNRGVVRSARTSLHAVADGVEGRFQGQLLDRHDGLPSIECIVGNQPSASRDARGRLWFATLKGAAMIDPARFEMNPVPPPPIIEELVYFNPSGGSRPGESTEVRITRPFPKPLEIPPDSRRIEVHFTAPSFVAPEKVAFEVRLTGLDHAWREPRGRRVAFFDDLGHGEFRFQVRAANDDGLSNAEAAALSFIVLPHVWQTGWFWIAVGLAVLGLAAAWIRRIRLGLARTMAVKEEFTRRLIASQENERRRLARDLHDDVTQRLARLAIDAGLLEQSVAKPEERQALREIRGGLARLGEDVHSLSYQMHPSIIEDIGLVEALKAEGERVSRQVDLSVEVSDGETPHGIPRDLALCLFRVAQEALNNVVRHAQANRVTISLRSLDGGLQLAVQDNGRGFDASVRSRSPSLGLNSMRERVQLLQGQLDIESAPDQGTAIVVWLPMPPRGP